MPPLIPPPPAPQPPRIVCYHQTHYHHGTYISLLPLLTEATSHIGPTHLIIAAIHLNARPGDITLNDDPPAHPKNDPLWAELAIFQDIGVKVLGMLGGAAPGSFTRLDGSDEVFEAFYAPLRDLVRERRFDGLDLDVEEEMSLAGMMRLIDRLKGDFGAGFLVTLAPVATALLGLPHLSGFDYEALEVMRGGSIECYHTQFYNNWGELGQYHAILERGWRAEKVVVGVLTNPGNGQGWVGFEELKRAVVGLREWYPGFGGVMGWEYFNSVAGEEGRPWEWAEGLRECVKGAE